MPLTAALAGCGADPSPAAPTLDPFAGSAGATEWIQQDSSPEGFGLGEARFDSPGELLRALMEFSRQQGIPAGAELRGDILSRTAGSAMADLRVTGIADGAFVGVEAQVSLIEDSTGWFIDRVRYRTHCRRAVEAGGRSCR